MDTSNHCERAAIFEQKRKEMERLTSILWEFDCGEIYLQKAEEEENIVSKPGEENEESQCKAKKEAEIEKSQILSTYIICGDKALHICMHVAYSYDEGSEMRRFLVKVAKKLISKHRRETATAKNGRGRYAQTYV
jgi:hypothetical protein